MKIFVGSFLIDFHPGKGPTWESHCSPFICDDFEDLSSNSSRQRTVLRESHLLPLYPSFLVNFSISLPLIPCYEVDLHTFFILFTSECFWFLSRSWRPINFKRLVISLFHRRTKTRTLPSPYHVPSKRPRAGSSTLPPRRSSEVKSSENQDAYLDAHLDAHLDPTFPRSLNQSWRPRRVHWRPGVGLRSGFSISGNFWQSRGQASLHQQDIQNAFSQQPRRNSGRIISKPRSHDLERLGYARSILPRMAILQGMADKRGEPGARALNLRLRWEDKTNGKTNNGRMEDGWRQWESGWTSIRKAFIGRKNQEASLAGLLLVRVLKEQREHQVFEMEEGGWRMSGRHLLWLITGLTDNLIVHTDISPTD